MSGYKVKHTTIGGTILWYILNKRTHTVVISDSGIVYMFVDKDKAQQFAAKLQKEFIEFATEQ